MKEKLANIRLFFTEVGTEMKKTSWPSRQELIASTVAVIICVILLSLFIGISDKILISLLKLVV